MGGARWTAGQATGKAVESANNELEPAMRKVCEGRHDEVLVLIRERAAKHPELAGPVDPGAILSAPGQNVRADVPSSRRPSKRRSTPMCISPSARWHLGDGRFSDVQLNFQNAQGLIGAGHWAAE